MNNSYRPYSYYNQILKNLFSRERVNAWFFVTFNIILSHIFPEIPQVVLKILTYIDIRLVLLS